MTSKPGELFLYNGEYPCFIIQRFTNTKFKTGKKYFSWHVSPTSKYFPFNTDCEDVGLKDAGDILYTDIFL